MAALGASNAIGAGHIQRLEALERICVVFFK